MLGAMEILALAVVAVVVVLLAVGISISTGPRPTTRPALRPHRKRQFCVGYGASAWAVGDLMYQDGRSADLHTGTPVPEGWYRIVRRVVPVGMPGVAAIGSAELWVEPVQP